MNIDGLFSLFAEVQHAGRVRAIEALIDGDPTAWTILGCVVVVYGGIHIIKSGRAKRQAAEAAEAARNESGPEIRPPM
jgi:hypothetical protein